MNRYIIVDGLPYLYAAGKAYAVRWDSAGFTVGAEIELKSAPAVWYNELSIKAQCAILDSIGAAVEEPEPEPAQEPETEEMPEPEPAAKKNTRGRKKATKEAGGET